MTRIRAAEVNELGAKGNTLVVDGRDAPEVDNNGKISGSVHVSRGMLALRSDPDSPYHDKTFSKDKTIVLHCASGGRAALAGKALKDLGYANVFNLGGLKDWIEAGGAIDKPIESGMKA